MELLLIFLNVLANWRVASCFAVSIGVVGVVLNVIPQFPDGGFALIVATGTTLGIYWQGVAEAGPGVPEKGERVVLSRPVECLSLWFFGAIYGGMLSGILGSRILAALAIVLSVVVVAVWNSCKSKKHAAGYYTYVVAAMEAGFGSLLLLLHHAQASP